METVRLPLGQLPAWRVRLRPGLEQLPAPVARVAATMAPPLVVHFAQQPPHPMVRVEFPTGPFPWHPRATIEATRID